MAKKPAPKAAKKSGSKFVKLSEVADLLRLPPGVKDQKVKQGGKKIKSISITDIPEAGYISSVDSQITLSADKYKSLKKYVIRPYDVIMSIQGTVGTVGIVPEKFAGNWLANISLLVIRFSEKQQDNAVALCMYLKSSSGRDLIAKLQKGDAIKRINVKEFAAIRTPVLDAAVKKASGLAFKEELNLKARIDDLYAKIGGLRKDYRPG